MEAAAEGAVGLSEARDGSPLSVAAASDDGDTVVGVSYGIDAADMGTVPDNRCEGDAGRGGGFIPSAPSLRVPSAAAFVFRRRREQKAPTHLC